MKQLAIIIDPENLDLIDFFLIEIDCSSHQIQNSNPMIFYCAKS